jgi:hypothetical protein
MTCSAFPQDSLSVPAARTGTATERRVRRALIDHVALVPEPAYEAAKITAVRGRELLAQR